MEKRKIWSMTTKNLDDLLEAESTKIEMLEQAYKDTNITWEAEYLFNTDTYTLTIFLVYGEGNRG